MQSREGGRLTNLGKGRERDSPPLGPHMQTPLPSGGPMVPGLSCGTERGRVRTVRHVPGQDGSGAGEHFLLGLPREPPGLPSPQAMPLDLRAQPFAHQPAPQRGRSPLLTHFSPRHLPGRLWPQQLAHGQCGLVQPHPSPLVPRSPRGAALLCSAPRPRGCDFGLRLAWGAASCPAAVGRAPGSGPGRPQQCHLEPRRHPAAQRQRLHLRRPAPRPGAARRLQDRAV